MDLSVSEVVEDFVELLHALRAEGCEFLVVGGEVSFIGLDAMIVNKRASGRLKDLADVETLEAIRARALRR